MLSVLVCIAGPSWKEDNEEAKDGCIFGSGELLLVTVWKEELSRDGAKPCSRWLLRPFANAITAYWRYREWVTIKLVR